MAIYVEHDTLGKLEFPSGMSEVDMTNAIVGAEAEYGEQYDVSDAFTTNAVRSMSSSSRQIGSWLGTNQSYSQQRLDRVEEHRSRVMMEQHPKASIAGMLAGGFLDPITLPAIALKPLAFASKALTYGARGIAHGAAGGALEPVYEQYGDSAALNIAGSSVIGGVLGGGIGKLLTKKPHAAKADELEEATDKALESVTEAIHTPEQAMGRIKEDLTLQSKGAEDQSVLDILSGDLSRGERKLKALEKVGSKLKNPITKLSVNSQIKALKASTESQRLDLAGKTTKRNALDTLTKLQEGKFSEVADLGSMINNRTQPFKPTKIVEPVTQRPTPLAPSNSELFKKLGIGESNLQVAEDSAGARKVSIDRQVAQQMLPRTDTAEDVTRRLVEGKVSGENKEPIIKVKLSSRSQEATNNVNKKMQRGEEPTSQEWDAHERAYQETEILKEYTDTVAQIAATRGLDTSALRGFNSGRYTFANIEKSGAAFLRKNNIKDLGGMVKYILDNPEKIFSAQELAATTELMIEVDNKLFNTHALLKHADVMSADEISILHADINLYYGIQGWFKGQGSKVSASLNFRRKMYQDIADNREIESLFAGVKC